MNLFNKSIEETISKAWDKSEDKPKFVESLLDFIHDNLSQHHEQPVDRIRWIDKEKVQANDYNPNSVATNELKLLYHSIKQDGYTQPIVTIYDEEKDKYIIVDGFHRHLTLKLNQDISDANFGKLPCVVIKKNINDRMASTVRHNRARGKHSLQGMSSMVFNMLDNGWSDSEVCNELGMEADELIRLKHITGFSKLFENVEYAKAWETKKQIKLRMEHERQESQKVN